MPDRWVLHRAGIVNVYQYGEETLHFGGGRLLLRGVNGSGKSTAMNMLLPFLLEAETRRIDAAGEQSGVLRSWMLSGREEPQPQGYLWIEFRNGDDYLTCGCGIRANQSTDRVATWWFLTPRRPGIDLALVEKNTPLSADALRAELGTHCVYSHDQRGAYRNEIRNRLFGGADLDQHLRLLHVVRNPRVGDRIDLDLPRYLEDALPQLSEAAIIDAAQPLEDLEEHRRNVEDLTRTAVTLHALAAVFESYARSELRARAEHALRLVGAHGESQRQERRAHDDHHAAALQAGETDARLRALERDETRLRVEIESLQQSEAYRSGVELNDLRDHVHSLAGKIAVATEDLERRTARTAERRADVVAAGHACSEAMVPLRGALDELSAVALAVGLSARPPDIPSVDLHTLDDDGLEAPTSALDIEPRAVRLAEVRAGAAIRGDDVREVQRSLDAVDRAESALRSAERHEREADEALVAADAAFAEARIALHESVEAWRSALHQWWGVLATHRAQHELAPLEPPELGAEILDTHHAVAATSLAAAQATIDHHRGAEAELVARRTGEADAVTDAEASVAELAARTLPDAPIAAWQRPDRATCLAELIDFAPHVSPTERAAIEAAMDASGLLRAELATDGTFVLADGQLAAGAASSTRAHRPLGDVLIAKIPDHLLGVVDPAAVDRLLAGISTDPDDLAADADTTVVALDGRFRTGVLRGRHTKAEAEHIGLTARRANLERQRADAARHLDVVRAALDSTDRALVRCRMLLGEATEIRETFPSPDLLVLARQRSELSEDLLQRAAKRLDERRAERADAESAHADAADASRRLAATHALPTDRHGLDGIVTSLAEIARYCDRIDHELSKLAGSVTRWIERAGEWRLAVDDQLRSEQHKVDLDTEHEPLAMRLATLEDTVGLELAAILDGLETSQHDLGEVATRLTATRREQLTAHGLVERAAAAHRTSVEDGERAAARCVDELPVLHRVLAIPGLVAAALPATETEVFPTVDETPDGVRALAHAITSRVPEPEREVSGAEGVRQSLRQRRDSLGAGWDAEDRYSTESLPLYIEVTGPLGRMTLPDAVTTVQANLDQMSSLLSAKQDQALRNLLQGLIAREVAEKLHAARELVQRMNRRLDTVSTSHGIGVSLRWRRRDDLEASLTATIDLLAKPPDLRTVEEDIELTAALSQRIGDARRDDPEAPYRELIATVLDYRSWHRMALIVRRPGQSDQVLSRRTALSEGEKKMVSYLPLFAAVAASCDALAEHTAAAPRFVLLDDAFAKVSEDNHAKLFGLLVELELDFIATSERLWGTHSTVPELAITEVIRDADLGVIVLEHSRWNGRERVLAP